MKAYKVAKNQSKLSYHQDITRDNEISYTEQIGYLCMSTQVESNVTIATCFEYGSVVTFAPV